MDPFNWDTTAQMPEIFSRFRGQAITCIPGACKLELCDATLFMKRWALGCNFFTKMPLSTISNIKFSFIVISAKFLKGCCPANVQDLSMK